MVQQVTSRIVVKGLPKKVTAERLREVFSSKGNITDVQLKYTKDGIFRQFAFIGFKTSEEARAAKDYFDGSFLDAAKIKVEICSDFGDPSKPKAWSKYAKDSSAYKRKEQLESKDETTKEAKKNKKEKHKSKFQEMLEEVKDDETFNEFLELHKSGSKKLVWSNDAGELNTTKDDSDSDSSTDDKTDKVTAKHLVNERKEEKLISIKKEDKKESDDEFTLKLNGLPYKCKKKDVKEFFRPLKIVSLRLPPKVKGIAYVKLKSEKQMKLALNKHRSFLSGHRITVVRYTKKKKEKPCQETADKYADKLNEINEGIAESGRIFVRNLSYNVTEDDLRGLFSHYGALTEVHLPVDSFTRKVKGFAFITFMFPEHAVNAYTALDKTIYQGRILHLLPSKEKEVKEQNTLTDSSSYKQKKIAKLKQSSNSSHNWNTLFLGANAVADVVADKHNVTKADLLNVKTSESLAVRMALGETHIVSETRQFLVENGVALDSFNEPTIEHSNTAILVKNLQANTKAEDIRKAFSKYGAVIRVVLPPNGIAAIVEYEAPSEARNAYRALAYSEFQNTRLFLQWAPNNVFTGPPKQLDETEEGTEEKMETVQEEKGDSAIEEDDSTPPDNTTLFVRNLDFSTTEEALKKHFQKTGKIHHVRIATKKDPKNPGSLLSMGYGFVVYKERSSAQTALKTLQHSVLDDRQLELKFSNQATQMVTKKKEKAKVKQKGTKILVKNIPFEAKAKEVEELFKVYGELKHVRLPKKLDGTGSHRGFGFVDFVTENNAKRAFEALAHSTHLLGRRLVLEWANTNDDDVSAVRRKTAENFHKTSSKIRKMTNDL